MKKILFYIILASIYSSSANLYSIYLWEYKSPENQRSCCFHFSGTDICNPNTPCTYNIKTDLDGIYRYIQRILGLEKASSFSFYTTLQRAQYYINHLLSSSLIQLSYRQDVYNTVEFFHDLAFKEQTQKPEKTTKDKPKEDLVLARLIALGVARPLK